MYSRICSAIVVSCFFFAPVSAQTVRFDTNVGTFDMELNPTGNPNLQAHVDNILNYVNSGRYDLTVINRAAEGFVMQMGGLQLNNSLNLPTNFNDFPSVQSDSAVIVDADDDGAIDFDVSNINNTRGTVTLALAAGDVNSGTSSFFVNIIDNVAGSPFNDLDSEGFVPFANVTNLATIDLIMGLPQTDFSQGSLAGDDVPTLDVSRAVFVERAFVVDTSEDDAAAALLAPGTALLGGGGSTGSTAAMQSVTVPEPPALVLAVGALVLIYMMKPHKIQ